MEIINLYEFSDKILNLPVEFSFLTSIFAMFLGLILLLFFIVPVQFIYSFIINLFNSKKGF